MRKIIVSLSSGLLTGFALSYLYLPVDFVDEVADGSAGGAVASGELVRYEPPADDIYRTLREEREINQLLRAEIDRLQSEVERMAAAHESNAATSDDGDWLQSAWADLAPSDEPADRRQLLIDAGFAPARAEWILTRESELQMAAIEARYRDPAASGQLHYMDSRLASRKALHDDMGDYGYEQYLAATGQSTTILITEVLADSPAQDAGFRVGDEIVYYDGMRVFNVIELADKARDGAPGGAVTVNIKRDGAPMQLVLPRGPLGISGGKPTRN
ncbi:MAG: PDZ domain-containing protein [Woeseiaceae bacterium]